jgi:RNA polymerase sigma factor (sigma-70 family)
MASRRRLGRTASTAATTGGLRKDARTALPTSANTERTRTPPLAGTELTDAELVQRCASGDGRAWEAIVLRYRRLIYAIPTRMGLEPEESDEVFQNTFVRLVERLDTIRDPSLLRAWLVTTARRLSLDCARRRTAVNDSDQVIQNVPDRAPLPEEELSKLEDPHLVRRAFERLPERCRALLELLYYTVEPPSYEAIGQRLRMPVGSIGPTRARCLQRLLAAYREVIGDAAGAHD